MPVQQADRLAMSHVAETAVPLRPEPRSAVFMRDGAPVFLARDPSFIPPHVRVAGRQFHRAAAATSYAAFPPLFVAVAAARRFLSPCPVNSTSERAASA